MSIDYLTTLRFEHVPGNKCLRISRPWVLQIGNELFIVPNGWFTDGGSVPRLFWRIIDPPFYTEMLAGAVFHDACYRNLIHRFFIAKKMKRKYGYLPYQDIEAMMDLGLRRLNRPTRFASDNYFFLINKKEGYDKAKNHTVHRTVRIFGRFAWKSS